MPLEKAGPGTPGFGRNIKTELAAGKPERQAVAIAYSKSGERKDAESEAEEYRRLRKRYESGMSRPSPQVKVRMAELKRKLPLSEQRKDGTDIASGIPLNAKLDAAFQAADALYARSDAMESGRWDAERDLPGEATGAEA